MTYHIWWSLRFTDLLAPAASTLASPQALVDDDLASILSPALYVSPQAPRPLNQDHSPSNVGIHDIPSSQEALCRSLYKDSVVAKSIEDLTLLLVAPYSLCCGDSFDLASLLSMLPSKMPPSGGLDKEDRLSYPQILAVIIHGFQILLDHSSAMIETRCSKILQGCQ
jgi:hypothetical protein